MNRYRYIPVAAIMFTLLTAGCISPETSSDALAVSVSTDQNTYTFGESMQLQVIVNTTQRMDNVIIQGEGLISSKGVQLRFGPRTVELLPGTNIINFSRRIPSCSPCTNLNPGSYNITTSVSQDGNLIAEVSCTIKLAE